MSGLPRYPAGDDEAVRTGEAPESSADVPWQRLNSRMIWVDAAQSLLALTPLVVATVVVGGETGSRNLFPLIGLAVFGVLGAVGDAVRWFVTRYRVTDDYVERRTGLLVRRYRSVRRDRIRSIDTEAKLRHRLSGLRVLKIGAGQQAAAGESALDLDAVSTADAEALRRLLSDRRQVAVARPADAPSTSPGAAGPGQAAGPTAEAEISPEDEAAAIAVLDPQWVLYNVVNVWAFVAAMGLLWGAYWLADSFGVDAGGIANGVVDWGALGWIAALALGVVVVGAIGVVTLALNFFTGYWNFELARVSSESGTVLRTRQGLFKTREVNRDDSRMRGMQISEPLPWRWMHMAETSVVTTGLSLWSASQPASILPRCPLYVARRVAVDVLGADPSPLEAALPPHPRAALRRRVWWASVVSVAVTGLLVVLAVIEVVPAATPLMGLVLLPVTVAAAFVSYRALGHAVVGEYVVVRSGLTSRATTALQRSAVSTVALRESILQRRLGLQTVSAMTSAGYGVYEAPDVAVDEAVGFAIQAAPGLLDPFVVEAV